MDQGANQVLAKGMGVNHEGCQVTGGCGASADGEGNSEQQLYYSHVLTTWWELVGPEV